MRLLTGNATRAEVRRAQYQILHVMGKSFGFSMDWDETELRPVGEENKVTKAQSVVIDDDGGSEMQSAQSDVTDDNSGAEMQDEALPNVTDVDSDVDLQSVGSDNQGSQPDGTVEKGEGDIYGQSRRHIYCTNYEAWFYVLNYCLDGYSGPVNRQNFNAMSRLGLSVCDTRRLLALGLAQLPEGEYPDHEARHEDLGTRLAVWRRVFEWEYYRVCKTRSGTK